METVLVCRYCGEAKALGELRRDTNRPFGHSACCIDCDHEIGRKYREQHRLETREKHRAYYWANREKVLAHQQNRERARPPRAGDPKQQARWLVEYAVAVGKIVKPEACQRCGRPVEKAFLHGHHEDYSQPLQVIWLCPTCHGITQRKGGDVE